MALSIAMFFIIRTFKKSMLAVKQQSCASPNAWKLPCSCFEKWNQFFSLFGCIKKCKMLKMSIIFTTKIRWNVSSLMGRFVWHLQAYIPIIAKTTCKVLTQPLEVQSWIHYAWLRQENLDDLLYCLLFSLTFPELDNLLIFGMLYYSGRGSASGATAIAHLVVCIVLPASYGQISVYKSQLILSVGCTIL